MTNIVAIIPIKQQSTRIPGKNWKNINDKPLYWWILHTLQKIESISQIIVNTDSEFIQDIISLDFPNLTFYRRPKHLEGGHISTNLLLLDTIESMGLVDKNNIFLQTHVTNPLLKAQTINKCIQTYFSEKCDSLFTVKKLQTRLYNKKNKAINHNPKKLIPTQDLDPIYEENSCLYIFDYKTLKKQNSRIGKNPFLYIMEDIESSDIDWPQDFILAEQLMKLEKQREKVVIVTGSKGGIGQSIVEKFKSKGWFVVGLDLEKDDSADISFIVDLSQDNDYESLVGDIIQKYGRIDCLVNNAAVQICKYWDLYTSEDWRQTVLCNIQSVWALSRACRQYLSKTKGSIINISSVHSLLTSEEIGLYAMSKTALVGLTKSMSLEYIKDSIRINCILPGAIDTPMLRRGVKRQQSPEEAWEKLKTSCPYGDIGTPKDVADGVYFLQSSNYMVGSSLSIDGGVSIKLSSE